MQVMRLFVAIPADERLRRSVVAIQGELRRSLGEQFRWERPSNLHVTLKVLGDGPVDGVQEVVRAVRAVASASDTTVLTPRCLDAFPSPARPRVLVLSLDDAAGVVSDLARRLEEAFAELGFPPEPRSFRPHITLGRARRTARIDDVGPDLAAVDLSAARDLYVDALTVYQSDLSSSGAEYTVLAEEALGEPQDGVFEEM